MYTSKQQWSEWYAGTERQWAALPAQERQGLAFAATGCLVAWPTWGRDTQCLHIDCRIARGERRPINKLNGQLLGESHHGWLRFLRAENRDRLAAVFRAHRKLARQTGEYDMWANWAITISAAVS